MLCPYGGSRGRVGVSAEHEEVDDAVCCDQLSFECLDAVGGQAKIVRKLYVLVEREDGPLP